MKNLLIFCILFPIFPCFQSKDCNKVGKRASLECDYYVPSNTKIDSIQTMVNLLSQTQVADVYVLTVNRTKENILRVLKVRCVQLKNNFKPCPVNVKSNRDFPLLINCCLVYSGSYMIIDYTTVEDCAMKLEDEGRRLLPILFGLYSNNYRSYEFNFTCTINGFYDVPKPYDDNPYAKTSLISVIFLSICAVLMFVFCFGWLTCSYYRRFKQRRIKIQQKNALENSVQKFLKESPVIIFNLKIKTQHFTDDDPMCAICLESFKNNDKIRKLRKNFIRVFFVVLLISFILFKDVHIIFIFYVLIPGY
jgi:hypothetical protein